MTKDSNVKQLWVDAVVFTLNECVRFIEMLNEAQRKNNFAQLPLREFVCQLTGEDGRKYTHGREAQLRLEKAAETALRMSKIAATVSFEPYMRALEATIVDRFITKGLEVNLASVDSAFTTALNEVAKIRGDSRHLIPCQLMFQPEPDSFSIGPVTFYNRDTFKPVFEDLTKSFKETKDQAFKTKFADEVISYFDKFSWVADVTIKRCDQQIGKDRATQAVGAAVDVMHLLFGHYHSRNMIVGGPGLNADIRASMEVRDGETKLSYSIGSTSAMGFPEGWSSMLEEPDTKALINAAGRAIEAVTDPSHNSPLAMRFIDAAAWHGQAVRETSAAASIVKSVTSLERLVTFVKSTNTTNTTKLVTERNAALSYDTQGDELFVDLVKRMGSIYDLRSALAHGTRSPFDPEVIHRRSEVLAAAEKSLINWLFLFDQYGLFHREITKRELATGFENLINRAKQVDAHRTEMTAALKRGG